MAAKLVADRNLSAASFVLRVSDGSVEALPPFGEQGAWFEAFSWSGGEEVQESGGLSGSQQGNETILVADEPGVRKLVCDALALIGYTVLAAADGYEAMGILEQHSQPVHLLLTDVIMPLMSGRDLAKRVQSVTPATKVVYMSGYTDDALSFHGFPRPTSASFRSRLL